MTANPDKHKRLRLVRNTLFWLSAVFGATAMVFFGIAAWIGDPQATSCANTGGIFLSAGFVTAIGGAFAAMVLDTAL